MYSSIREELRHQSFRLPPTHPNEFCNCRSRNELFGTASPHTGGGKHFLKGGGGQPANPRAELEVKPRLGDLEPSPRKKKKNLNCQIFRRFPGIWE